MADSQKGRRRWNQALQRVHAIENQIAERMRDQSAVVAPPRDGDQAEESASFPDSSQF
jgi:hypothetical protein